MNRQYPRMNYHGPDWAEMKAYLEEQSATAVKELINPETDSRKVENLRGKLQFISHLLSLELRSANDVGRSD